MLLEALMEALEVNLTMGLAIKMHFLTKFQTNGVGVSTHEYGVALVVSGFSVMPSSDSTKVYVAATTINSTNSVVQQMPALTYFAVSCKVGYYFPNSDPSLSALCSAGFYCPLGTTSRNPALQDTIVLIQPQLPIAQVVLNVLLEAQFQWCVLLGFFVLLIVQVPHLAPMAPIVPQVPLPQLHHVQ